MRWKQNCASKFEELDGPGEEYNTLKEQCQKAMMEVDNSSKKPQERNETSKVRWVESEFEELDGPGEEYKSLKEQCQKAMMEVDNSSKKPQEGNETSKARWREWSNTRASSVS